MLPYIRKLTDLIPDAANDRKVEDLIEIMTSQASFDEVAEIKTYLNDKLFLETDPKAKYNYKKAIELLE